MIGRLHLLFSLFALVLTSDEPVSNNKQGEEADCLDTLHSCYEKVTDMEEIVTLHSRTEENVFHYCEDTRTRVVPCMARSLNMSLGPTAYDKGVFLYNCPYYSSQRTSGHRQIMKDLGKGYLLTCVYNDIRNLQHRECIDYMIDQCGMKYNKTMAECSAIDPCPPYSNDLYAIYSKRVIHATAHASKQNPQFKKKSESGTGLPSITSSTTVSTSLLSLLIALVFH